MEAVFAVAGVLLVEDSAEDGKVEGGVVADGPGLSF